MSVEKLDQRVHSMDKELRPTIEGVSMAIYATDGDLILLRGDEQHYTFEDISSFHKGDPEYRKNHSGALLCKYRNVSISISKEKGKWVATVE